MYSDQFGFLSKKSTSDAILKFTDKCYSNFNDKNVLISVFIDLSKAFDTLDFDILLNKMERYGIRGSVRDWFSSYLKNRCQYVNIGGSISPLTPLKNGVPQGSILGSLLFIIYINDMHKSSDLSYIHYADDSTVYAEGPELGNLVDYVNTQLEGLDTWMCSNKLSLNLKKTHFTIFSNKPVTTLPIINIRGININFEINTKFLGVIIDNKLNFSVHIDGVCKRVSRSLGILKKLSLVFPSGALRKIYYSMVHPFLTYAIEVWGDSCKKELDRLRKLTSRCIALVSVSTSQADSKILDFDANYRYFCLIKLFKYLKLNENDYFKNRFSSLQITHGIETRSNVNENLNIPQTRSSKLFRSFYFNSIKLWNKVPSNIKNLQDLRIFKKNLLKNPDILIY